jgi:hypothetical protein
MDRNNEDIPVLVAGTGPLNGQRWALHDSMIVGREPGCDIVVPDRQVSRNHARITPSKDGVLIEDLGSKNGTHRNGDAIQGSAILQDGDVIQIALAQQFVFLSSDATVPLDSQGLDQRLQQPPTAPLGLQPGRAGAGAPPQESRRLRLDKRSRRVWVGDQEMVPPLSVSQFRLLELLVEGEGQVVTRQALIADVWGEEQAIEVSEQALDALIRRLRDRLAVLDPLHTYIVTVRGHGLRLDNPVNED